MKWRGKDFSKSKCMNFKLSRFLSHYFSYMFGRFACYNQSWNSTKRFSTLEASMAQSTTAEQGKPHFRVSSFPSVGPNQLGALIHLECTCEAGAS